MSEAYQKLLVKDLMTPDVITVSCTDNLRKAMDTMREHKVKCLVVDKRSETDAWGMLTYTDILKTIARTEGDVGLLNVYDLATKPALTIPAGMEVRLAARMMLNFEVKRLVVTGDNDAIIGILTMHDVVGAIIEKIDS